jgi:hypothetical protein
MRCQNISKTGFLLILAFRDPKGKWHISYTVYHQALVYRIFPKIFLRLCLGSYIHTVSSEFVENDLQHEHPSGLLCMSQQCTDNLVLVLG